MGEAEGKAERALRSLCRDNGWSYGVLWRFDPRNSMLLTMEDAVYEEDHLEQIIGNLLLQVHVLGEGVIGQAAVTGKHQWIFADSQENQQADPEVLRQFSAGVETLVVIPLEHRGVVQFGAMRKIREKAKFVDETKKLFCEMDNVYGIFQAGNVPSSSNSDTHDMNSLFASLLPHGNSSDGNISSINCGFGLEELIGNSRSTAALEAEEDLSHLLSNISTASQVKSSFSEGPCISSWSSEGSVLTSLEPTMLAGTLTHGASDCMKMNTSVGNSGINHFQSFDEPGVELPKALSGLKRSFNEFDSANPTADVSSSCLIDDLSQWLDCSTEHGIMGPAGCFENSIEQSTLDNAGSYNVSSLLNMESDPFDSFGLEMGCILDGNCWDVLNNSNPTTNNSLSGYPSMNAPRKGLFSELGIEELLEGVGSTITKSSFKDPPSASKRKGAERSLLNGTDSYVQNEFLPKSQVGLWIDDSYSINAGGALVCPPKRAEEPAKPIRKRARPGESTRPRPKDRQQIQDRLKELRGIIPNGAKCSIDTLLDRTVKHMLFLQNVMKYADKLKQSEEPKLTAHENGVALKDESSRGREGGSGGGKTWAFEMGSQSMVCPIIVEDLNTPGQMLIEMLCEEGGLFLEIADVVRGFGLNILKGVMEVRHSKIWCHFIVEATRHVTRMDVFWSLVQLLQQTAPSRPDFPTLPNHLMDGTVLPCQSYKQSLLPLPIS